MRNGGKTQQPQNKTKKPSAHSHQAGISLKPLPLTEDMQVDTSIKNYSTSTSTSPTTCHFLYLGPSNPCRWEDTGLGRRSLSEARKAVREAVILSLLHNGAARGGASAAQGWEERGGKAGERTEGERGERER